jgi:hypothetical protein
MHVSLAHTANLSLLCKSDCDAGKDMQCGVLHYVAYLQPVVQCIVGLVGHHLIGLVDQRPPLRVAQNNPSAHNEQRV